MTSPVERLTAPGVGGVAVLALGGELAEARLAEAFSRALPGPGAIAHGILHRTSDGAVLDEVLVVRRSSGRLELHLHGSPAVVRDARAMLAGECGSGGREVPDPTDGHAVSFEERALRLVHRAPTALGARILLDQAEGALRHELAALRTATAGDRARALAEIGRRGLDRQRLFERTVVVLTGPVNAGKSTLFNVLLGEEAAAVTAAPGTTRDALGARARFGPWPVILVDTAGLRDLRAELVRGDRAAAVESDGQRLAAEAAGRADVVFELLPLAEGPPDGGAGGRGGDGGPRALPLPAEHAEPLSRVVLTTQAARQLGPDARAWGRRVISALEAPEHARGEVLQAFREALGLGLEEADVWRPGLGVPFERALSDRIANLGRSAEVRATALDALLAEL